jgi:hypothetical protein
VGDPLRIAGQAHEAMSVDAPQVGPHESVGDGACGLRGTPASSSRSAPRACASCTVSRTCAAIASVIVPPLLD